MLNKFDFLSGLLRLRGQYLLRDLELFPFNFFYRFFRVQLGLQFQFPFEWRGLQEFVCVLCSLRQRS